MSAESWITLIVAFAVIYGGLALCIGIALGRRTPYKEAPPEEPPPSSRALRAETSAQEAENA